MPNPDQEEAGTNNPAPPLPGRLDRGAAQPLPDEKPALFINHEEHKVTAQAISLLALEDNIYQRSNILVRVYRESDKKQIKQHVLRAPGTPRIGELKPAKVRNILTRIANVVKNQYNNATDSYEEVPAHPPDWLISQIMADGDFYEIPRIEAIVECPVIRDDGSIISIPGHDERTGILYEPNANYLPIPETVSLEDAVSAADELSDLINQFPFSTRSHKAAWLAALLTLFARFAIPGPCPLFLFESNAAGTGKSLLCDLISVIYCGRPMPRTSYPESEDEMRKRITAFIMGGDALLMFDNIAIPFGGASLDAILTSLIWKDRVLGKSESVEMPIYTVWFGTGNNIFLKGDIHRRIIPCTLNCDEEKPQLRDFKYERLLEYAAKNRIYYVKLCLTILRGFFQAGKPRGCKHSLGSFEYWSDVVRSCVLWVTGEDCVNNQDDMRDMDAASNFKITFIAGLSELPRMKSEEGQTADQILNTIAQSPNGSYSTFKTALSSIVRNASKDQFGNDKLPSAFQLGHSLRKMRNCVVGGKKLVGTKNSHTGIISWKIKILGNQTSELGFDDDE